MKKKFLGILLAASLCVALAACGGDAKTNVTPTPEAGTDGTLTPEPTEAAPVVDEGTTNTMTEDMFSVTVSTNKTSYEAGEKVYYTIKVENNHELYALNKTTLEYKNSAGLKAAIAGSMPAELPQVLYGETYEIHGILVGDEATFPAAAELPEDVAPEYGEDPYNGTKSTEKVSLLKTNKTSVCGILLRWSEGNGPCGGKF